MKNVFSFVPLTFMPGAAAVSPARAQQTRAVVEAALSAGSRTTPAEAMTAADLVVHVVDTVLLPSGESQDRSS